MAITTVDVEVAIIFMLMNKEIILVFQEILNV